MSKKVFDIGKSNVSAELKALFQQTSTRASKVDAVPGVGGVTADRLKEKGVETVGDLVDRINCFDDLRELLTGVNRHKIFDCLDCYLKEKCADEYEDTAVLTRIMESVALVDNSKDEEVADEVNRCHIS